LTLPEKRAVLESMPRLAQGQVDQLTEILDTERRAFMAVWEKPTNRRGLLRLMLTVQKVWAELLLEDPDKADRLTLDTPLEGECPVPHWRHWPEYWLVLAHRLLDRTDRLPQALEAVDRALEAGAEPAQLAEDLLQGLDPAALPAHRLEAVEAKARALAPDDPWLGYYLARNRLAGPSPDKATARALLEPLLKDPPAQGRRCFELVALVLDNLPDLAPDTETASRRAVELEPDYAPGWNTLGNLLQSHLARYEEAEAAYRKAVELDPEYASPWNGLGLLQLYARGDCKAAVEAFEHGLALGEDDAAPYLRMNLAHTRLCTGQDPAEACPLLAEALAGFLAEPGYQSNRLRLALELGDEAEAARQVEAAQTQWEHSRDYDAAYALLLQACCHPDREPPEAAWERCRQAMASHDERFATLSELHLLAGLRPEARQAARELAGRLLDPDPDWVQGFRDRPGPGARWERFRPFVAGRSKGAGDPADGLCAGD
jgi:tetratricopeptide (TPR) repeat protein